MKLISIKSNFEIDDLNKYDKYHKWVKKLKLYDLIKTEKLIKPDNIIRIGLSDEEFALYIVLIMFKKFSHRFVQNHSDFYRNWLPIDYNGVKRTPRSLKKFMYYKIGVDYKWFVKTMGFFGPTSYFISDQESFKYIKKHVSGITIKKDGYPINSEGLVVHKQVYNKFRCASDVVDHMNGIRHDIRLINLRGVSQEQNMENKVYKSELYKDFFIGIFRDGSYWKAKFNDEIFDTAIEAAMAYDKAILKIKSYARTNKNLMYY